MQDFVHLHVHTQYSILDGQASIPRLVDKAIANGMRGIAITDQGVLQLCKQKERRNERRNKGSEETHFRIGKRQGESGRPAGGNRFLQTADRRGAEKALQAYIRM